MEKQRDKYAEWFARRSGPRNPQAEGEVLSIASIYDDIQRTGALTDAQLRPIVDGASSPIQLVWDPVTVLLRRLAEKWPQASDAVLQMSQSSKRHVRFAAICSLGEHTPSPICEAVLKSGLVDRAARVRSKAAERADDLKRKSLVPSIEAALGVEKDPLVRESIELSLRLLRDGYWLKSERDGRKSVIVRTSRGISSRTVDDRQLQERGVDLLISDLRE